MKGVNKYSFFLGFLGFLGFQGFTELNGDPLGLLAFCWFSFFANYWWARLGSREDERLIYNKNRAGAIALYTGN